MGKGSFVCYGHRDVIMCCRYQGVQKCLFVRCFYEAAVESARDGRMDRRPKIEKYREGVGESDLLAWLLGLMASLAGRKSVATYTHTHFACCYEL